jgi:hypothetical protein
MRGFLKLANDGLPGHDTFSRLFHQLYPTQFGGGVSGFMTRQSQISQLS